MGNDDKTTPQNHHEHHMEDAEEIAKRDTEYGLHGEPDDLHYLVHHTELPDTKLSLLIDNFVLRIGGFVSWGWIVLMMVIVTNVTLRYLFGEGRIEFEEIQWHIYAVGFMVGLSYCMEADDHVRVDVLHDRFSLKAQAWVEIFGLMFLLFPFIILVLIYAIPFVESSYAINEVSDAPAGLPYRWAIKSALIIGFGLLGLATFARLLKATALVLGFPKALPPKQPETAPLKITMPE